MMRRRIAIYTCIAGDYDDLLMPRVPEPGADYLCFTDQPISNPGVWQLRPLPRFSNDVILASRYVKMHPHLVCENHDLSVYVDSSIRPLGGIVPFAEDVLRQGCLAMYRHPVRNCVFDEADECALLGHDFAWRIGRQMRRYRSEGLASLNGLYEASILVRRHHDPALIGVMDLWWREFLAGVKRDQLSLSYVLWKQGVSVVDLGRSDARFDQLHFALTPGHKKGIPARRWFIRKLNRMLLRIGG